MLRRRADGKLTLGMVGIVDLADSFGGVGEDALENGWDLRTRSGQDIGFYLIRPYNWRTFNGLGQSMSSDEVVPCRIQ